MNETNEVYARQQAQMNPTDPQALMEKLAKQQVSETQLAEKKRKELEEKVKKESQEASPVSVTKVAHEVPDQRPVEDKSTTKTRIREVEEELSRYDSPTDRVPRGSKALDSRAFLDEYGDETYYVENISDGHVVISDVEMDKIPRGKVVDLLQFGDLTLLKKSRDLRIATTGANKLLKRLTPEEYLEKREVELQNKKKVDQYRQLAELKAQTNQYIPEEKMRPVIDAKIELLRISSGPEPHKGMTPVEFMEWVGTEKLTAAELDYIAGSVQDKDIKIFIYEKKKQVIGTA